MRKSKKKSRAAVAAPVAGEPYYTTQAKEDLAWWHEWQGYWSRRISEEHRLVYRMEAGSLYIAQARYHY